MMVVPTFMGQYGDDPLPSVGNRGVSLMAVAGAPP